MSLLLANQGGVSPVNYVLSCDSGSYTYTGQAATLQVSHSLTCAVGAYTYTGNDAILAYVPGTGAVNYTLSCDAGSYVYTGQDATLVHVIGEHNSGGWYVPDYPYERYKRFKKKEIDELLEEETSVKEEILSINDKKEKEPSDADVRMLESRISNLVNRLYELRTLIALLVEQEIRFREEEEMMMLLLLEAA